MRLVRDGYPRVRRSSNGVALVRPSAALAAVAVACGLLSGLSAPASAEDVGSDPIAALRNYVDQVATAQPTPSVAASTDQTGGSVVRAHSGGDSFNKLRVYLQKIADKPPQSTAGLPKLAESDTAIDALRQFLQQGAPPSEQPKMSVPPARSQAPFEAPVIAAKTVGSKVCLGCHADQVDAFSHTLMGRLQAQGKMECETCHGPGSAHVAANGCAGCHGEGGISRRPGVPSLVGMDAPYIFAAMKQYVTGQRKNSVMRPPVLGLSDGELNRIAAYYAGQPAARAQTPAVGDAAAGRGATAVCAGCHGEQGISPSPAFPSLAGQDALYLADAIKEYKSGSRQKAIACAACHGERGVSKIAGMPSMVGLDPQYFVAAMKAYAGGHRKNAVMKAIAAGVSDSELNAMAAYYAGQAPARAETPSIGDAAAGKAASAACAGCHGAQGVSANPQWPSLAGQDARYLAEATKAYKTGARGDEMMKGMVATLDDRTINDLAGYYASLAPAQPAGAKSGVGHEPVLIRNGIVASLDERAVNNIASYYASLRPAQPAKGAVARRAPGPVGAAAPADGLSVGGIISFRPDDPARTVEQNNAVCLNCHDRGQRIFWQGSVHEQRNVACTNCHTIMAAVSRQYQLKTSFQPDTCFQCHKDRRAQMFQSSHMPMREGKVVCSDCHAPHGSPTEPLLKKASVNEVCYICHAEKRGPFLWEHEPVRENCDACHDPHGSVNQYSLRLQRPRLCTECHNLMEAFAGAGHPHAVGQSCENCHVNIHGSNSPAGELFFR